jgi:hypothetical protein
MRLLGDTVLTFKILDHEYIEGSSFIVTESTTPRKAILQIQAMGGSECLAGAGLQEKLGVTALFRYLSHDVQRVCPMPFRK